MIQSSLVLVDNCQHALQEDFLIVNLAANIAFSL
jgi:hypothetical protein